MKVSYPHRLLFDYHFFNWLLKNPEYKSKIIYKLMYINNSSAEHKKEHNLLLTEDFEKIIAENLVKSVALFKGGIKVEPLPLEIDDVIKKFKEVDIISKRILFSIYLTDEHPYSVIILTTKENQEKYEINPIIQSVKYLSIKSYLEALNLIDFLFRKYCSERNKRM